MGAVQLTFNSVGLALGPVTVGASGFPGASVTSVTVMVSVCLAVISRAPAPLVAVTVRIYSLLVAAFAGVELSASLGFS